jgi:aryl-alcohol dehydrogenase-like predicted oxidoreductase
MQQRRLGEFAVSAIGLGCMNLSHAYGTPPPADVAGNLLLRALDRGITFFDTAALYGFGNNETCSAMCSSRTARRSCSPASAA